MSSEIRVYASGEKLVLNLQLYTDIAIKKRAKKYSNFWIADGVVGPADIFLVGNKKSNYEARHPSKPQKKTWNIANRTIEKENKIKKSHFY